MLMVIDVGNTNIVIGVYKGETLVANWRLTTKKARTSDEMGLVLFDLFSHEGISHKQLENVIISSVVPDVMYSLRHGITKYLGIDPIVVGPGIKTGINIRMENPKELGADRLVNMVAALELYGGPTLVIDYGTANTYDVLLEDGTFITGFTSPGVMISAEALCNNAALLSAVEIKKPETVIVKNTITSIQAGLVYGAMGETTFIVQTLKRELNLPNLKVVATGGLARTIAEGIEEIFDEINPMLTLEGLRIIYEKNKK